MVGAVEIKLIHDSEKPFHSGGSQIVKMSVNFIYSVLYFELSTTSASQTVVSHLNNII